MSCRKELEAYFESLADGDIVIAAQVYRENFIQYSEMAFFKLLERMVKSGYLYRVSKGMYAKYPVFDEIAASVVQTTDYVRETNEVDSDDAGYIGAEYATAGSRDGILNYFFGENNDNGMFIGYRLYAKYGLTNEDNGLVELYSNRLTQATKSIGLVKIKRVTIDLKFDNARIIEMFEIFQNYFAIKGLNQEKVDTYARQAAINYNDETARIILKHIKYKKSTIAAVKNVLDLYEVQNSLGICLSCTSKYKIPTVNKKN